MDNWINVILSILGGGSFVSLIGLLLHRKVTDRKGNAEATQLESDTLTKVWKEFNISQADRYKEEHDAHLKTQEEFRKVHLKLETLIKEIAGLKGFMRVQQHHIKLLESTLRQKCPDIELPETPKYNADDFSSGITDRLEVAI